MRRLSGCMAMLLFCAGCGAQPGPSENGGMFSFFKNKDSAKSVTTVHPDAGAQLVREKSLPPNFENSGASDPAPPLLALNGVPPQATLQAQRITGQTTSAWVAEAAQGRPRLALVNINAGRRPYIEVWEIGAGDKPSFTRKRNSTLDPEQESWSGLSLLGVAQLPQNRFLLGISYRVPQVKHALFVYDSASDSYTKLANVVPHLVDRKLLFDAQAVAPNAVIVKYYTASIRLAPEVYYNTPTHLRLFSSRHPQGIELVKLSAEDGSVGRWTVIDKTLWLDAWDIREKHQPKALIWSLNLGKVLPP